MSTNQLPVQPRARFSWLFVAALGKLLTLRAVTLPLLVTIVTGSGLTLLLSRQPGAADDARLAFAAMGLLPAGFIASGVMATTSDTATGQWRTTLLCIPDRRVALAATFGALTLPGVSAAALAVLFNTLAAMAAGSVGPPPVAAIVAATIYLTTTTLLAAATGHLLRRPIPSLAVMLGVYLLISPLLQGRSEISKYFPDAAARSLWEIPPALPASVAWTVLFAWTLGFLVAAIVVASRRAA